MFGLTGSKTRKNARHPDKTDNEVIQDKDIYSNIDKNLQCIKEQIGANSDLVLRRIPLIADSYKIGYVVYFGSFVDDESLSRDFLMQITKPIEKFDLDGILKHIPLSKIEQINDLNQCIIEICKGKVLFLIEGISYGFVFSIANNLQRGLEEPKTEKTIHGIKESFNENIDTNIFLVRRRLQDPKLVVEEKLVGVRTKTRVAIIFVKDIANDSIIEELRKRLEKIKVDSITGSGVLEQLIEDSSFSIFPQIQNTERPERVVESLLEGRICIICNGTSFALLLPAVLSHFLSSSEDYFERTFVGSFNRFLRYIAVFITITLPSLYIALTSLHPELIPFDIIIPLAESRKEIPFPPLVEAFLLEITVEFLREMGTRLPQPTGNTLGVVGGIVLGDAAIRADLVSPAMVIVVGVTAVISFTIPNFSMVLSLRFLRFFVMIMAGIFGAFGITISWLLILTHLIRLESFSIPYLSPFAPLRQADLKDTFFRTFMWKMKYRPNFTHPQDIKRKSVNKGGGKNE
jgi:Bacillus/Clostridium GerA spore germination protein.